MSHSIATAVMARPIGTSRPPWQRFFRLAAAFLITVAAVVWTVLWMRSPGLRPAKPEPVAPSAARPSPAPALVDSVRLTTEQQKAIGLRTVTVRMEPSFNVLSAPGEIVPNSSRYAFITPRAAGVVRKVEAHIGQDVKAGDLLATIDSPEVGTARLELYTRLQSREIALSQADWQRSIYQNTLDLIDRLREGKNPEEIHRAFEDRAVGLNREKLMTAYAQYRLARATFERNRDLYTNALIPTKQYQKVTADYEVAEATYHGLMDQIGYEVRLEHTRAQQALKQAETSVRAAREHLRILGVKSDGTEPAVEEGKVVGVKADGTLDPTEAGTSSEARPEKIIPPDKDRAAAVEPVGAATADHPEPKDAPVSTYSIWAPFDGTILDRQLIVPGVPVDTTHRIFTLADLSTVWIEARVHESDFGRLARIRGARVALRTPAYPGRVFDGDLLYGGDMVEQKSRAVKLLARANNPDRLLKPGMFVDVEVLSTGDGVVARVPASALLTRGDRAIVYVRAGLDRFVGKEVEAGPPREGMVSIASGLGPDDEVVVEGAYKLRSLANQGSSPAG